jgi:hypothetical protein
MWIRALCIAAIGLVLGFASTSCTDEEKPYRCAAWCAQDLSDIVYGTFNATDATDAQSQCFAAYNCNDMPGQLLKCDCDPL